MSTVRDFSTSAIPSARPITISAPAAPKAAVKESFWGEDGFTFGDLVDLVNPLQHIPVVSSVYRAITGDTQSTGAKVLGGGLFGGVIGLLASFVDASTENTPGQGVGERAIAALLPGDTAPKGTPASTPTPAEAPAATEFAANIPETLSKEPLETSELPAVPEVMPPVPELGELPPYLPGEEMSTARKAEIDAAIQKYLEATAKIKDDEVQDNRAALAADMLL